MSDVSDDNETADFTPDDQSGEQNGQFDDEDVLPDNDRPYGVQRHGTTPLEEEEGAGISLRVLEEEPDPIATLSYDFPDAQTGSAGIHDQLAEDDPNIDVPDDDAIGVGHTAGEVTVVGHVEGSGLQEESDEPYAATAPTDMLERSEADELEPTET